MSILHYRMRDKSPNLKSLAEAERWYARLRAPDCTAAERGEFQRWQATAENAAAFLRTELLWQSVGELGERAGLQRLSQQVLADTASPARLSQRRRTTVAAAGVTAGLVVVLCAGTFVVNLHRETAAVIYATKPGERATVNLADGSQLVLNYSTELDVRLSKHSRTLTLHKGEALFTVAHDVARPFKVDAAGGEVTAVGTRFEVRSELDQVAVTLLEGRVTVDRSKEGEHLRLEPGDQVRFSEAAPRMILRRVDPEVISSWTTGRLRFRATPLAEALAEVNRYSSTSIRIIDATISGIPISGTFEVGDTDSVVSALEALLPIQAARSGSEILLRRRD